MRVIEFICEIILFVLALPVMAVCMVINAILGWYDQYTTKQFFKRWQKDNK